MTQYVRSSPISKNRILSGSLQVYLHAYSLINGPELVAEAVLGCHGALIDFGRGNEQSISGRAGRKAFICSFEKALHLFRRFNGERNRLRTHSNAQNTDDCRDGTGFGREMINR